MASTRKIQAEIKSLNAKDLKAFHFLQSLTAVIVTLALSTLDMHVSFFKEGVLSADGWGRGHRVRDQRYSARPSSRNQA